MWFRHGLLSRSASVPDMKYYIDDTGIGKCLFRVESYLWRCRTAMRSRINLTVQKHLLWLFSLFLLLVAGVVRASAADGHQFVILNSAGRELLSIFEGLQPSPRARYKTQMAGSCISSPLGRPQGIGSREATPVVRDLVLRSE